MSDLTTLTNGAEPSSSWQYSTTEAAPHALSTAAAGNPYHDHAYAPTPDDAHTPPVGDAWAQASRLQGSTAEAGRYPHALHDDPEASEDNNPDNPTLHAPRTGTAAASTLAAMIASLPEAVADQLSAAQIQALSIGDPTTIAATMELWEQLLEGTVGTANNPTDPTETADLTPHETAPKDRGIERISLRGLSVQDQYAVAEAIAAVKSGQYASFAQAGAALAGADTASAPAQMPAPNTAPQLDPLAIDTYSPVQSATQRLAELESLQREAAEVYDVQEMLRLSSLLSEARVQLHAAQTEHYAQQAYEAEYDAYEQECLALMRQEYGSALADPAFAQALEDARDLAEYRDDPVMDRPDWAYQLIQRMQPPSSPSPAKRGNAPAFPTPPPAARSVRGALESPVHHGLPTLTVPEALSQLDQMSESQIDAVLLGIRQRESAARLHG